MEAPKEEKKYSCKVCEKTFTSFQALGGHMGRKQPCHKRKTESAYYGNEEPEDLTPESKLEEEIALADNGKNEELEDLTPESKVKVVDGFEIDLNEMPYSIKNDIPESGAEEAARKSEEKKQIEQAAKPGVEADVLLTDLKTAMYECKTCHRSFGSQQVLGDHLAGQTSDGTCPQDIESTAVVPRFNCDGYILKSNVVWATQRRS
ncbi:C2H2-type zinc finger [Carex littledalei]|uniref:C2H2-type zinc finger n=1 Tax=Carex littledalei TaxID=544730 RepID=A0A833QND6_9POAL|nr:C2H2-type zinc finger [Carex littledalei]